MAANVYTGYGAPMSMPEDRLRQMANAFTAQGMQPQITAGGWGGMAQGFAGLAQALAGKTMADKADRKRQESVDRLKQQTIGLGIPEQYRPLVDIFAEQGDLGGIASLLPGDGEGFTLGENQVRYGPNGEIVARGPEKQKDAEWLEAKGPGGITFKYQPGTGQTNLAKPQGGFYTLPELGGAFSGQPAAQPQGGGQAPPQFEPTIQAAAKEAGVPPDLLRELLRRESNFNPNAVSKAGAQGIAQFMPATAGEMGIDPLDPQESIYASAKYLRQQYDRFKDWGKALAAYNAGPGRVAAGGALPKETQDYVAALAPAAGGGGDFDWEQFATSKGGGAPEHFQFNDAGGLEPIPGGKFDPKSITNIQTLESNWRAEFKKPIEQATDLTTQIGTIRNAVSRGDGTGDIAAITSFNKLLDPGAVVREADVALTLQAQGLADQLKVWMKSKQEGDVLPQPLRERMLALSEQIYATSNEVIKNRILPYAEVIEGQGGKFTNIIPPKLQEALGWTGGGTSTAPNPQEIADEIEKQFLNRSGMPSNPPMY